MSLILKIIESVINYIKHEIPMCNHSSGVHYFPKEYSPGLGRTMSIKVLTNCPCNCGLYRNFHEYTHEESKTIRKALTS